METLGNRFKKLRAEKGFTQDEILREFNTKYHYAFTKNALSLYENDKRTPEVEALKNWADYFGVTVDYLLGVSDKRKEDEEKEDERDPDIRMIARARKEMSEEDREKMMNIIKTIFDKHFK